MRIVLCVGVFDLLHAAHVRHLKEARFMGDCLFVGVTRDNHVGKPGRPIIPENERLEMVNALRCVSAAALHTDSIDALKRWQPDIFVKGADYSEKGLLPEEIRFCEENKIEIRFTQPNPQTTTGIIERIREASCVQ